jgi:hypothetical protein
MARFPEICITLWNTYIYCKYLIMKQLSTLLALLSCAFLATAQIEVDSDISATEAVESYFLTNGVFVSNITFSGGDEQIGLFDCVNCNLGIASGLIMATGDISLVEGPNSIGSSTVGGGNIGAGDADLETLVSGFSINDAAVLEFDFIASGDSMLFEFVFGSEEYPEFVNSAFNDVFGFFVSGPGIDGPYTNGAVNIALIPGTDEPVAINSVNEGENSEFYVDNSTTSSDSTQIGLDGFTTVLAATLNNLVIGESYHIKLAIGDASDSAFDSAVCFEASSFELFCGEEVGFMAEECLVSSVEYAFHYTVDCGVVNFENNSEVLVDVTSCDWDMGDGTLYTACAGDIQHEFDEPGIYQVKLTYHMDEFYSTICQDVFVSDTAPETPIIGWGNLTNWDGVSTIQWYFNGEAVKGETGVQFEGFMDWGDYYVIVSNGCASISNTFTVSIDELAHSATQLYPNPSSGNFSVVLPSADALINVFDLSGRLIQSQRASSTSIDLNLAKEGIYLVEIRFGNGKVERLRAIVE